MSVKSVLAKLLEAELAKRGISNLSEADCNDITTQLLDQLRDFELKLAARELVDHLPKR